MPWHCAIMSRMGFNRVIVLFALVLAVLRLDAVPWSYPPRAWPRWEILRARSHTYACGMYVGYPAHLADATKCATFRGRDGRVFTVSASSQGGVPCVRGEGFEVLDEESSARSADIRDNGFATVDASSRWVKCDVFDGTEDSPPHLMGFPAVRGEPTQEGGLYAAGCETVAFICCRAAKRPVLRVGESRAEALNEDPQWFEQSCRMEPTGVPGEWRSAVSLAFRYYRFAGPVEATWFEKDEMRTPQIRTFSCDDARRNRIWQACANTVRLCSRRFFVDAVKRDRMVWSGDQATAFLADSATFVNAGVARFSIDALGCARDDGLVDYSPWWVIINGLYRRLYDDVGFIAARWPTIRRRTDVLTTGARGDGLKEPDGELFVDWGERGRPTTAYNVLRYGAFATAAALADEIGRTDDARRWSAEASRVRDALRKLAYDPSTGLFRTDVFASKEETVYRQANLLAVLFGLVEGDEARRIGDVLAEDGLPAVGTTWMMGLENVVLMATGHADVVLKRIDAVWGVMADRGFDTTFEHWWKDAKGADSYRYYDRPFGLALCHVTAASPAFLLPRIQQGDFSNPFAVRTGSVQAKNERKR